MLPSNRRLVILIADKPENHRIHRFQHGFHVPFRHGLIAFRYYIFLHWTDRLPHRHHAEIIQWDIFLLMDQLTSSSGT